MVNHVEPWFAAYQRAVHRRQEPHVYLLVSLTDATALMRGETPARVQRQATRLVTWTPRRRRSLNLGHPGRV